MAKSIDASKLERIKEATVELVVSHGYNSASVSLIAKRAGVADGYLYRFYSSKYDLVSDIFKNKIGQLADVLDDLYSKKETLREVVYEFVAHIINRAKEFPTQTKFLFMLIHDYTFEIDKGVALRLKETFEKLVAKGQQNGEINPSVTSEDLYVLVIGQTLLYIDSRFRRHFGNEVLESNMAERVANVCLKAIH
jgi:TetR/AcrR family transcriptional regulator, repressor of fatR-cypB operon